jgi:hypothetical protein
MMQNLTWMSVLLMVGVAMGQVANAQPIWFAPHGGREGAVDFQSLFAPSAPWQTAAASIQAFQISDELIYDGSMNDAELRRMFTFLNQRKIDLAVEIGVITGGGPGQCGYNVEGYGLASSLPGDSQRIKSLGGDVRYFAMDEPLFFGHVFERDGERVGCRLPIDKVAQNAAEKLRQVRTVFPSVRFGDEEPLMSLSATTWLTDLAHWFDAYKKATGDTLAFFRVDVAWDLPWKDRISQLVRLLHDKNIPLQVTYNGTGQSRTDEEWIASAVANFQAFEAPGGNVPDAAVFQYWTVHPSHVLPESDPRTATWLINKYVTWRSSRQ